MEIMDVFTSIPFEVAGSQIVVLVGLVSALLLISAWEG